MKYIFGILESKGLKLEYIIIIWCFFFVEEKMLVWYWKENYYNYIYIIKKKDVVEFEIYIFIWIKGICIRFVRVFWLI